MLIVGNRMMTCQFFCLLISATEITYDSFFILKCEYKNKSKKLLVPCCSIYEPLSNDGIILPTVVPEIRYDEERLNNLASETGIDSGDVCYEFTIGVNDPTSAMPSEYVVNCSDVLKLAVHLKLDGRKLRRFWSWFLRGCREYLKTISKSAEEAKRMLDMILDEKREDNAISAIIFVCSFSKFAEFECLKPTNLILSRIRNSWMLYLMVRIALLSELSSDLAELITLPHCNEHNTSFELKVTGSSIENHLGEMHYSLHVKENDMSALESKVDMVLFWKTIRELVLSLGPSELHLSICSSDSKNNIIWKIVTSYSIEISGSTENDSFFFILFEKSEDWSACLKQMGLTDVISRLFIKVCSFNSIAADTFSKQLKEFKNLREVQLASFINWNDECYQKVIELRSELKDYRLILSLETYDKCNINILREMNLDGIRWRGLFSKGFFFEEGYTVGKNIRWKCVNPKIPDLPVDFFKILRKTDLRNVDEFIINSWKDISCSIADLIIFLLSKMSHMEKIKIYGSGEAAEESNTLRYVECTHKNVNSSKNYRKSTSRVGGNYDNDSEQSNKFLLKTLIIHNVILFPGDAKRISEISLPALTELYLFVLPSPGTSGLLAILLNADSKLTSGPKKSLVVKYHFITDEEINILKELETRGWNVVQECISNGECAVKVK